MAERFATVSGEEARRLARAIVERASTGQSERSPFVTEWEKAARLMLPRYQNKMTGIATSPPSVRSDNILDIGAVQALQQFASIVEYLLTPRQSFWHQVVVPDIPQPRFERLRKNKRVQKWYRDVQKTLFRFRYRHEANYGAVQHESYMSMGAFGTGVFFVDEDPEGGTRYIAINIGDVYLFTDLTGRIVEIIREVPMNLRKAEAFFGRENLPREMQEELEKADRHPGTNIETKEYRFLHACLVNQKRNRAKVDARGKKWLSYYVAAEAREPALVSEGGFQSFPYIINRYVTAPNEIYGRGPGMMALGSTALVNEQKRTVIQAGHRTVNPPLLAHDDGAISALNLQPGAINYGGIDRQGRRLVAPMLENTRVDIGMEQIERERADIQDIFLVSLFRLLMERKEMTATEVIERTKEQSVLLSPTMSRQQTEALGPLIDREIDILAQQELLPPPPPEIEDLGGVYEIKYDSPMSRMARAEEAGGFMRAVEIAGQHAQLTGDIGPLDHFDMDAAMPEIAYGLAVPDTWMADDETIQQKRQARAQQAQAQMAVDAAPAAASVMKAQGGQGGNE